MIPTWVKARDGSVYINDLVRYVKGNILVPPVGQNPLVTPAAAAATIPTPSISVIFEGGEDAVTEIFSLMGAHDAATAADVQNRLTVEITDIAYRRRYMNRPIIVNHVFGSNLQPFFFNESVMLESQQSMNFQFFNNSVAGASTFRSAMEARKFQASALAKDNVTSELAKARQRKTFLNPFWLSSNQLGQSIVVPAGGTVNVFFENSRDYFLVLFYLMCQTLTTGAAGDTIEVISFRLFDAKTERELMNVPVTQNTGTGTSNFPYVLPSALMVEPRTTLRMQITNLVTDQPTEVWMTFHGVGMFVAEENPWEEMSIDRPAASRPLVGAP